MVCLGPPLFTLHTSTHVRLLSGAGGGAVMEGSPIPARPLTPAGARCLEMSRLSELEREGGLVMPEVVPMVCPFSIHLALKGGEVHTTIPLENGYLDDGSRHRSLNAIVAFNFF